MSDNTLHADTHIGWVHLTVPNLTRSIVFYQDTLGFELLARQGETASLGAAAGPPLLLLTGRPDARPRPARTAGLYHFAILLPSRVDLARTLQRLAEKHYPLQGASDHGVSEALYLADLDGNGIEIYVDRQPGQWPRRNGDLQMVTEALDVEGLLRTLAEEPRADRSSAGLPPGTRIGHVHLNVGDLGRAVAFYEKVLGFDLVQRYGPSAAFLSAGGYHHHIGVNTWAGVGAAPAPPDAAGLHAFGIVIPSTASLEGVAARLQAAGVEYEQVDGTMVTRDPAGNAVVLSTG